MANVVVVMSAIDQVLTRYAFSLAALAARSEHNLDFVVNTSIDAAKNSNTSVQEVLDAFYKGEYDFDYLFFNDTDLSFPIDALDRLMAHDVDIVGCTYRKRYPPHQLTHLDLPGEQVVTETGLQEVKALPFGMVLVKKDVLLKMAALDTDAAGKPLPFWGFEFHRIWDKDDPYYATIAPHNPPNAPFPITVSPDQLFCLLARDLGFKVWLDWGLSQELQHFGLVGIGLQ